MAFDAFCYFPGEKTKGETLDKQYSKEGAFEIKSFSIGAENNINIGSATKGGGAGKATFKPLELEKATDSASCDIFSKLCEGKHFPDMVIVLRRSGGEPGKSGADVSYLKWEFKLVMIAEITWSGSDGDDVCTESLNIEYGAMKVTYVEQKDDGSKGDKYTAEWSKILNSANLAIK